MKAEILKIAGVKSEKEFYKKFPTEEAFMKAHSKDFKKAKLGKAMPNAQYGCKGNSCTQTGEGIQKVGSRLGLDNSSSASGVDPSFVDYKALNAPLSWEELQKFNDVNPKSKEFKTYFKDLKSRYPDLTVEQLLAAGGDSARINLRKQNLERYDQPSEQTFDKAYHPFYRNLMNQPQRVTIPQVLDVQPGGYSGFEQNVKSNYGKKKGKEGTQVKKLKQLTSFEEDIDGMIPEAQVGLTMPQPTNIMTNVDPFWAQSQFGGGVAQAGMPAGMVNPTPPPPMYDVNQTGTFAQQVGASANAINPNKSGGFDFLGKMGGAAGLANLATDVISGVRRSQAEKEEDKRWQQANRVSDVQMLASQTRPEPIKRKYARPEDVAIQPEQLFPTYGVGTNVLAQDGAQIGGNPTEIQNMYNPGDLYSDLGFEPLNDSSQVKQYYGGGYVPQAQMGQSILQNVGGFAQQMGNQYGNSFGNSFKQFAGSAAGTNFSNTLLSSMRGGQSGGGMVGGAVGKAAGTLIGGPIGGFVGNLAGNLIGGAFDNSQERILANQKRVEKNLGIMTGQDFANTLQSQNRSFMEHGGWVSHDWQPQVIAKFGEHRMSDLLRPDPTMDTLRSGGHIRQNNMSPMDQYGFGGELQTTWGGYAEPISQNPYLPGTGETVMFRGKSHSERDGKGRTGIGVKYGNDGDYSPYMEYGKDGIEDVTDVEVERGEPAQEMVDPQTGEKNMVVFGNLKIPNKFLGEIGDPKAKGRKFKHYVAGLSKQEAKQNKTIDKSIEQLIDLDPHTSIDKLKFSALQANIFGANMKLKDIADKKTNASIVQNAINETAEEYGLDADSLAKGKYKMDKELMSQQAKFGKMLKKYQNSGAPISPSNQMTDEEAYNRIVEAFEKAKALNDRNPGKPNPYIVEFQKLYHQYFPDVAKEIILNAKGVTAKAKRKGIKSISDLKRYSDAEILSTNEDEYFGPITEQYRAKLKKPTKPAPPAIQSQPLPPAKEKEKAKTVPPVPPLKRNPWIDAANMVIPYLLPTDQEALDPRQLYGEMYALGNNQLEPVRAQGYRPQLLTPYDISLQDQLNEVTAQTRQAERLVGSDPAAVAAMSAQANRAKSQILGEQFRQNQAQRMGVYNQNINTLNQAQLQNLGIFDQQFARQEQAKSNTKAVAQAALNSISDKIAKNRLENRTLGIMENMYNYRFDRRGRAINMNPLAQFDVAVGGSTGRTGTGGINPDYEFTYDANGQIIGTKKRAKDDTGKNGKKVEKSRNGNIVKAIKNL